MNARYSPLVTSRSASWNGSRKTRWRGPSLSNAKPRAVVADPAQAASASGSQLERRRGRAARGARARSRYAGRKRIATQSACLMSVRSSSWCCCSWCRPSSTAAARAPRIGAAGALEQRAHRARRRGRGSARTSASVGRESSPRCGPRMTLADGVVVRVEQVARSAGRTAR